MTDQTKALLPVTPELLPCPFCGGPAELRQDVNYHTGEPLADVWFAICGPCDLIRDQAWSVPRDTAIEQWNTRSQSHSIPGDVGIDAERLARAMNPPLWADDEETAHMAASPIQVCHARARGIEAAKLVLVELAALTPSALSGDAGEGADHG